jgi:predicted phosphate transport protein (TIGR00153 family)
MVLEGGADIEKHCRRIIDLEHQADLVTRDVLLAVRKSFITPFDRSDITDLIQSMDDAIDKMQRMVKTIERYGQKAFDPRMRQLGETVVESARIMAEAIPLLSKIGTNSARLGQLTEAIIEVEERSDRLYDEGLRELFKAVDKSDAMAFIIGSALYENLEGIVDSIEDVANEINSIMVENL